MTDCPIERRILRRIRARGPQTREQLRGDIVGKTAEIPKAIRRLIDRGVIHPSRLVQPDGPGRPSMYYGIVGVHPRAVTMAERVAEALSRNPGAGAKRIAEVVGCHLSTARPHLDRLVKQGRAAKKPPTRTGARGQHGATYTLVDPNSACAST